MIIIMGLKDKKEKIDKIEIMLKKEEVSPRTDLITFFIQDDKIKAEFTRDEANISIRQQLVGFLTIFVEAYKQELVEDLTFNPIVD